MWFVSLQQLLPPSSVLRPASSSPCPFPLFSVFFVLFCDVSTNHGSETTKDCLLSAFTNSVHKLCSHDQRTEGRLAKAYFRPSRWSPCLMIHLGQEHKCMPQCSCQLCSFWKRVPLHNHRTCAASHYKQNISQLFDFSWSQRIIQSLPPTWSVVRGFSCAGCVKSCAAFHCTVFGMVLKTVLVTI